MRNGMARRDSKGETLTVFADPEGTWYEEKNAALDRRPERVTEDLSAPTGG
jgi:hypothetical protein